MDLQNIKPKKIPTKIEDMTKEQLRQAIIKKRECNAKAQKLVESLLEKSIKENHFLKCLSDINQNHMEDVFEERSILHLCGYPLCDKTILEKDIPKQKYRISIKTNKVYDITVRKSFCSNSCYKSAMHIKKQMLTSPLWFRDYEEIPNFNLSPVDSMGSLGQEVELSYTEKLSINTDRQIFTSIKEFANATQIDNGNDDDTLSNEKNDCSKISNCKESVDDINNSKRTSKEISKPINNDPVSSNNLPQVSKKNHKTLSPNPLNIVGEILEKPGKIIDPILLHRPGNTDDVKHCTHAKIIPQKKQHSITDFTIELEKSLAEWFTLDTLLFLFGEKKVKEMVADKGECIKEYLANYATSIFYNSNTYDQYQVLCRKLNMLELEDKCYDTQTLAREKKPLPDYSILKEESKKMELKVKAFLTGDTVIADLNNDTTNINEEEDTTKIPLVDKHAQNALRRRIVCQHLNKVLPDLLKSLGLLTLTISSDIRLLVNTFRLNANNIMFKPIQWTLMAIVFIKLLSFRDYRLEQLLNQQTAFQHMQLLLLSYKQDGGYLDRLIIWLTDIDRLLDLNDTQLTIG